MSRNYVEQIFNMLIDTSLHGVYFSIGNRIREIHDADVGTC
jgi:hypothetical protein